jgi:hypothetical protein
VRHTLFAVSWAITAEDYCSRHHLPALSNSSTSAKYEAHVGLSRLFRDFRLIENPLPDAFASVLMEPCKQKAINRRLQQRESGLVTVSKTVSKMIESD